MTDNETGRRINPLSRRALIAAGAATGITAMLPARTAWAAPQLSGVSLNLMVIQPHVLSGRAIADAFEAATGAKVNVIPIPSDQTQAKPTLDVQSGANVYDVIDYWYCAVGALADDGVIVDVTQRIEKDFDTKDFLPSLYDPYTLHDGKRWGVPYDGDTHVLFYNKEVFDRHGLKAPQTWADYLETVKAITAAEKGNNVFGTALLGAKQPFQIGCSYANRLAGFGGAFLTADGRPALDSDISIAAAQSMADVAPYALPTPLETAYEQALPAFLSGQAAMLEFWTDLGVVAQDPKMSKITDKWDVVSIPVGGANTKHQASLNAGFGLAVSSGSKQPDAAWELVKFACGKAEHLKLLEMPGSGIDPVYTSILSGPDYKAFTPKVQAAAVQALNGALPWPTGVTAPKLMQALIDELALLLAGSKTPEQAMKSAQAGWVQILAG